MGRPLNGIARDTWTRSSGVGLGRVCMVWDLEHDDDSELDTHELDMDLEEAPDLLADVYDEQAEEIFSRVSLSGRESHGSSFAQLSGMKRVSLHVLRCTSEDGDSPHPFESFGNYSNSGREEEQADSHYEADVCLGEDDAQESILDPSAFLLRAPEVSMACSEEGCCLCEDVHASESDIEHCTEGCEQCQIPRSQFITVGSTSSLLMALSIEGSMPSTFHGRNLRPSSAGHLTEEGVTPMPPVAPMPARVRSNMVGRTFSRVQPAIHRPFRGFVRTPEVVWTPKPPTVPVSPSNHQRRKSRGQCATSIDGEDDEAQADETAEEVSPSKCSQPDSSAGHGYEVHYLAPSVEDEHSIIQVEHRLTASLTSQDHGKADSVAKERSETERQRTGSLTSVSDIAISMVAPGLREAKIHGDYQSSSPRLTVARSRQRNRSKADEFSESSLCYSSCEDE